MEMPPISPSGLASESIPFDALLDTRFAAHALSGLPVADLSVARAMTMLARFNAEEIGNAIEVLVALLDVAGGDRTAAWCISPAGGDVNCAMVAGGWALPWPRYWRGHQCHS